MKNLGHQTKHRSVFVVEAYLAASPRHPKWSEITPGYLKGWSDVPEGARGSDKGHCFGDLADVENWLQELQKANPDIRLRVVHKQEVTTVSRSLIEGYEIEDGTVVREMDGSKPTFMGKEVEGCVDSMPTWYGGSR